MDIGLVVGILGGVATVLTLLYMAVLGSRSIPEWWRKRRQSRVKSKDKPRPEEGAVDSNTSVSAPGIPEHYSRTETQFLREQLLVHKKNLGRLNTQRAQYGIDAPLAVLNAIDGEEERIEEIQARLKEMSIVSLSQPVAFHNLPPRAEFIGREKEKGKILQALESHAYIIAIKGIGGIGKSCLALEVAHCCLHRDLFGASIWISAKQEPALTLEVLLSDVAETLNYLYVARLPSDDRCRGVRRLLQSISCLLIIDNFDVVKDEAVIDFLLDLPEPSKALITSRHRDISRAWVVPLGGMEQHEALALIRAEGKQVGFQALTIANDAELVPLYEAAGGVPLAMKWAVGQIAQEGWELDAVLDSLHRGKADMFESVFLRSYEMLTPTAQTVLLTLSAFDAPITREVLGCVLGVSHLASAIDEGVGQLVRMSLVEASEELHARGYSLHPLTRSFANAQLKADPQLARKVYQQFYEYKRRSEEREDEEISFKAVIFDLYDTLVYYSEADYTGTKRDMAKRAGVNEDAFLDAWRHYRRASAIGDVPTVRNRVILSLMRLGVEARESVIDELCELERQLYEDKCKLFDSTEAVLKHLRDRGLKVGLIAQCSSAARNVLKVLSIGEYFDQVVFTFAEGMLKPDPRLFALAADKLGIRPGECLYVGDGNDEELDGAHAAGMKTVLVVLQQTPLWRQEQSRYFDYRITDLMDVRQVIEDPEWSRGSEEGG